jgi:hypothetical protein
MFAIDHGATALLVKRRFPSLPMAPLLVSVQAMELAWVGLNYLGIETTTTESTVRSVADIHLAYMPYSHSVGTALGAALVVWLVVEKGFRRAALGRALGLGIISHLILDLVTHGHDIVLWPGRPSPKLGLGLYDAAPFAAFIVELVYGILCWRVYRGGRGLLALIVIGNLANLSFLSPAIPGRDLPSRAAAARGNGCLCTDRCHFGSRRFSRSPYGRAPMTSRSVEQVQRPEDPEDRGTSQEKHARDHLSASHWVGNNEPLNRESGADWRSTVCN